ncbi:MAG: 2-C-methyl-D-erythritol 2,4-cyclodiphosphate synthase [Lachnospiraceae bacterium]|jgi:2-C-methyl-D-erythritol 2,4-cyclodiphosphate synthase|nr:2-C-methyl-D-erythritol 2,4-cyclodiphosphate synthase [Lachnospiraceae bacterium]
MRIGIGYDVHQLCEGRRLILGGVDIPFEKGLLGHSDADVLIHAMMDAILGALGQGDIGKHFPDSDSAYKDISSLVLLEHVARIMREAGYQIGNMDVILIAQRPKVGPYFAQMKELLAQALSCEPERINLKATTEEHLGFTGREEGMAAQAVCLLEENR